ncbi:hypothetical protein MBLNU230_g6608t1 [Neophaeotheca triangularis]
MWTKRDSTDEKRLKTTAALIKLDSKLGVAGDPPLQPEAATSHRESQIDRPTKTTINSASGYDPSKGLDNLPGEVRNVFYRAAVVAPLGTPIPAFTKSTPTTTTLTWKHTPPALATAFPLLRHKILSLYYSENDFLFTRSMNPTATLWSNFLSHLNPTNTAHLRQITITHGVHYSTNQAPSGIYDWEHIFMSTQLTLQPLTGLVAASLRYDNDANFCCCAFRTAWRCASLVTLGEEFRRGGGGALLWHVGKLFEFLRSQEQAWLRRCDRGVAPACPGCGRGKAYWCEVAGVERVIQCWSPSEVWEAS